MENDATTERGEADDFRAIYGATAERGGGDEAPETLRGRRLCRAVWKPPRVE